MNILLPVGKIRVRDSQRVWDIHVYTAIFKTDKDHT